MKKRRKRNMLQRMMAVLLTAVLITGMAAGAVPAEVYAEENTAISENVSGNTTEPIEEETASEPVTEPETVMENETESETVTESETEPETQPETDTADVMLMVAQADSNIASGTDWVLDGNGVLTIKSDAGMTDWTNNGRSSNSENVKQAVLQDAVTKIEIHAFSDCTGLVSVKISSTVAEIGTQAFNDCTGLTGVEIPSGVTKIGTQAFIRCTGLASVKISSTVAEIGAQAFSNCTSLTGVTMQGETPPTLGGGVFDSCKFVTDGTQGIEVPAGYADTYKASWGTYADNIKPDTKDAVAMPAAAPAAGTYTANQQVTLTTDTTGAEIYYTTDGTTPDRNNGTKYTGEISVTGEAGISVKKTIKAIAIKDGMTDSEVLEAVYTIEIPVAPNPDIIASGEGWTLDVNGVLTIESNTGLSNWIVWSDTFDYDFNQQYSKGGKKLLIKKVVIETGVTDIVDAAFKSCNNLTEVHIPDTVTNIGAEAFRSCGLTAVDLPDNLQTIGRLAFSFCKFSNVIIPETVKVIPNECFYKCPLTSITIPAGITEIQTGAFNRSTLTEVKIKGTVPPAIGDNIFANCDFVTNTMQGIEVPKGFAATYKMAWPEWALYIKPDTDLNYPVAYGEGWSLNGKGELTISSDTGMSNWKEWSETFDNNFNQQYSKAGKKLFIKKVVIGTGVTDIVDNAFNSCNNLTEADIPDTVTNIGAEAFRSCFELTAVDLPDNLQTIGSHAFSHCKLTTVTIPETIKEIPAACFYSCPLTEVKLKSNVPPVIGDYVFTECDFEKENKQAIVVLHGYSDTYKAAWTAWKDYIKPDVHETSLVPAKAATCTVDGSKAYYTCSLCDKWFEDEAGSVEIADKTSVVIPAGHTFNTTVWKSDKENHWHECSRCGVKTDEAAHGYGDWTTTKQATENEEGLKERSCSVCGYKQTEVIPKTTHIHIYGSDWKSDGENHWHECSCGAKSDEAAHGYGDWTTTKQATENEEGLKERSCSVCGYKQTEVIPKTDEDSSDDDDDDDDDSLDSKKDGMPKTGDATSVEIYATLAMVSGLSCLILFFEDRKKGMTEQEKKELIAALVAWGRKGGKLRKAAAIAAIFLILVYYHSIGKHTSASWEQVYGE